MHIPLAALALRLRSLLALLLIGALALPDGVRATPAAQQVDVDIDAAHLAFMGHNGRLSTACDDGAP